jgi:YtkA-like
VRRAAHVRLSFLALFLVAAFFVIGYSRPIDSWPPVTVEHAISPEPPQVGPATVLLKLADPAAKPISGARITLEADMSHAGMAPVFEEASETEPGQYQAHLKFAMAGDWVILLHVRLPGGQTLERKFNVRAFDPTR